MFFNEKTNIGFILLSQTSSKKETVMDRRNFLQVMALTPFVKPILFSSPSAVKNGLYLLSDEPQRILPYFLKETRRFGMSSNHSYLFRGYHPCQKAMVKSLSKNNWVLADRPEQANLTLSFSPLPHKVPPSFTFVQNGHIQDLRSGRLFPLWQEMKTNHSATSYLTIASFNKIQRQMNNGESVRIFRDGRKISEALLADKGIKSFRVKQGEIAVKIENGSARIISSPCRHKICCLTPPVSLSGERIICAPNHFLLEIQGGGHVDTVIG
jgi:hypothetical protein